MKIIFFIDSLTIGGAEILTLRLAKELTTAGHDPLIIAAGTSGNLAVQLEREHIRHIALHKPDGISLLLMAQLAGILQRENCDILCSNHFRQLLHGFLPALATGTPHIHIEHDTLIYRRSGKYLALLRLILSRLERLVVIAPNLADWFRNHLPPKYHPRIQEIRNGIDTDIFKPSPATKTTFRLENGLADDCCIIGTCARLEPVKNLECMLEIFHSFHTKSPNSRLLIIGDGSLKGGLKERTTQLGLDDKVIYAGSRDHVVPWLQAMDLYLITSIDEGLPLSALEAMACGVPVMAHDVGDLGTIISSRTGWLMPDLNLQHWVEAILQLTDAPSDSSPLPAAAQMSREWVVANASFTTTCKSYMALFESRGRKKS